ncbi:MAG: hypothetical protein LC713_04500, partial [Actinobacteria bacterium]|nr:hypothetical protein [Actinomycetota bacterium]
IMAKYNPAAGGANASPPGAIQIGGAIAFSYTDHNVRTWVTNTADLNSNDDDEITSGIIEELGLSALSTGEKQKAKLGKKGNPKQNESAATAVSLAIVIGDENNTSRTIIGCATDPSDPFYCDAQDDRPELDAMRALRILSGVSYPFLTRPDEFAPSSLSEFSDGLENEGIEFLMNYTDGTLGLASLLNTDARSLTEAKGLAIAGSINVVVFNNTAESIVHSGAKINQDPFYRPAPDYYTDPDNYDPANNDNITHSSNANNVDEHVVSIEATNWMQVLNLTGQFQFVLLKGQLSASFGPDALDRELFDAGGGASGKKGGVGGAFFTQILNNAQHAIVEDGVQLYSGRQSGLNVKAEELIFNLSFTQAGAASGKLAVGGSFAYFQQTSDTLAEIQAGSEITGGRVDVYAGSLETQVSLAGGIAKSKAIGVGASIAINNVIRSTKAVIGEAGDSAGSPAPSGGFTPKIDIEGAVTARAIVKGEIWAFTVAGAIAIVPDKPTDSTGADADPMDGLSLPLLFGAPPTNPRQSGTGVAIAAAVSVNKVSDTTQGSLADYAVTADAVDVKARNGVHIVAATGGLAFAKANAGGNAAALAGGFSYNGVDATTDAFVRDTTITLRDFDLEQVVVETAEKRLSVTADSVGDIWTLAAGGGGAVAAGNQAGSGGSAAISVAGSVSVNRITGHTRAKLIDSTVSFETTDTDTPPDPMDPHPWPSDYRSEARVRATDSSDIFAIAGSLSLAIAAGQQGNTTAMSFGVAIAVNLITRDTDALIDTATLRWGEDTTGGLDVQADAGGSIQAFTVAGALAVAAAEMSGSGVAGT